MQRRTSRGEEEGVTAEARSVGASPISDRKKRASGTRESTFLPQVLRQQRLRKGWSQENLAEKLGVSKVTIHRWECGETRPVPFHRRRLCEILGVTFTKLFPEASAPTPLSVVRSPGQPQPQAGAQVSPIPEEVVEGEASLAAERLQLERLEIRKKSLDSALSIANSLIDTRYPGLEATERASLVSRLLLDLLELPERDVISGFLLRAESKSSSRRDCSTLVQVGSA
jgi:transcriptional regulator with XRE-family HTH domain